MKERARARARAKKTPLGQQRYKTLRKKSKKLIKTAYKQYIEDTEKGL